MSKLTRCVFGEIKCMTCKHVAATLTEEVAEPPLECSKCGKMDAFMSPTWKLYCDVHEGQTRSAITVDGFTRTFEGSRLMDAVKLLHVATCALFSGDKSLMDE
jgi:hypothetical protein